MEKIFKEKQIYWNQKNEPFTWGDIKNLELEDDDIIISHWQEAYYSENESWDGHYHAEITRMVLETDEEFDERRARTERAIKENKERRRENYLRLKKEFENETNN